MRFAVESWSPDYGAPMGDDALVESTAEVNAFVEVDATAWAPRAAPAATARLDDLLFVDGVRRVEAHVWITDERDEVHQGICASYAAGGVHCNGAARVVQPQVRHGLFSPVPDVPPISTRHVHFTAHVAVNADQDLSLLLQTKMGELEAQVAAAVGEVGLVVVDGPLKFG